MDEKSNDRKIRLPLDSKPNEGNSPPSSPKRKVVSPKGKNIPFFKKHLQLSKASSSRDDSSLPPLLTRFAASEGSVPVLDESSPDKTPVKVRRHKSQTSTVKKIKKDINTKTHIKSASSTQDTPSVMFSLQNVPKLSDSMSSIPVSPKSLTDSANNNTTTSTSSKSPKVQKKISNSSNEVIVKGGPSPRNVTKINLSGQNPITTTATPLSPSRNSSEMSSDSVTNETSTSTSPSPKSRTSLVSSSSSGNISGSSSGISNSNTGSVSPKHQNKLISSSNVNNINSNPSTSANSSSTTTTISPKSHSKSISSGSSMSAMPTVAAIQASSGGSSSLSTLPTISKTKIGRSKSSKSFTTIKKIDHQKQSSNNVVPNLPPPPTTLPPPLTSSGASLSVPVQSTSSTSTSPTRSKEKLKTESALEKPAFTMTVSQSAPVEDSKTATSSTTSHTSTVVQQDSNSAPVSSQSLRASAMVRHTSSPNIKGKMKQKLPYHELAAEISSETEDSHRDLSNSGPPVCSKTNYEKRKYIIEEIIKTEENYNSGLQVLKNTFRKPLLEKGIITIINVSQLFSPFMASLVLCSDKLVENLKSQLPITEPDNDFCIGAAFVSILDEMFIKAYVIYAQTFEKSHTLYLNLLKQNAAFAKFIKEVQKQPQTNHQSFEDFSITVIQRLPQYIMLISELLKNTSPNHNDYISLKKAHRTLQKITDLVNQEKKKLENSEECEKIHKELGIEDFPKDRLFIYQDCIYSQPVPKSKADLVGLTSFFKIYLFSDVAVLAKYEQNVFAGKFKKCAYSTPFAASVPDNDSAFKLGKNTYYTRSKHFHEQLCSHFSKLQTTST
eukprot:TRINITY_DN12094_c0_g1_i1.p1 TRINITY_DN12094_c0_g1~~TRINITY_DN12094_c0_g1_i1.p1  ORF type:complete len:845 (+),score=197.52 TRINITY_DN12094_c0_g1_i1:30-2537(+)